MRHRKRTYNAHGKKSKQVLDLFHKLFCKPVLNIRDVQEFTGLFPKSGKMMWYRFSSRKKILKETTGFQKNRVFIFIEYIDMFDAR